MQRWFFLLFLLQVWVLAGEPEFSAAIPLANTNRGGSTRARGPCVQIQEMEGGSQSFAMPVFWFTGFEPIACDNLAMLGRLFLRVNGFDS